ncbi:chaperone modulator CbpM [Flavobacterium sp. SM2513]|uniref:chaperone modulator CbpM n=1 Tax=Flavobacterium sp. SM2513 TaxID=3424766 RepID=UPI003D7F8C8E
MEQQDLIIIDVFCKEYHVEINLIEELEDFGLIEIHQDNGLKYIQITHLPQVEKVIRFHNELNINKEGIEVVLNLLERLNQLNEDVRHLKDKLKLYE